jgi:hypothetical protein
MRSKFSDVNYMLEVISMVDPEYGYVEPATVDRSMFLLSDPPVVWAASRHYTLWIPSKNVQFMPENLWYPGHAAALVEGLVTGEMPIMEQPAARVYRVTQYDVESTQGEYAEGTLEEESQMAEPWTSRELGEYHATLVDGNHRAAAAMLVGLQAIPVIVGENWRENVDPRDWVRP